MKLKIHTGKIDGNYHGPNRTPRRSSWAVCKLDTDTRRARGWRLWLYGKTGAATNIDLFLVKR